MFINCNEKCIYQKNGECTKKDCYINGKVNYNDKCMLFNNEITENNLINQKPHESVLG